MAEWIVAHCHANAENKAEVHLTRQGFEVYFPKIQTTRRHARRIELVVRPLFPRYLFICFDKTIETILFVLVEFYLFAYLFDIEKKRWI